MDLDTLLLLIAFRHRIKESDFAAGFSRFKDIVGRIIDEGDFQAALNRAVTAGRIYDPVRLPAGALQCHWCLEVTPDGAAAVRALMDERALSVSELIDAANNA
jgi:hypothetical protein